MKKLIFIYAFLLVLTIRAFSSYTGVALAANPSESTVPQNGDLCGGTGGYGQIINVGENELTIKRNDDGKNQIVHLTDHATIETSTDSISLSNLKEGDRVTLVGGPNRDGSFTADTIAVCGGMEVNGTNQITPLTARKENTEYKKVSSIIDISTVVLCVFVWFVIAAFLRLKKKKGFVYLLFFTIFYIYLYKVLDYTLLQFQSLLLLQHFVPDLMLNGFTDGTNVNLIPLATLTLEDLKTSLLNILMMVPFGFGLPFITNFRTKKVVAVGLLLSIAVEFLQLITGLAANATFRVADVNDLIFNTIGVIIGYMLFVGFVRIFRQVFHSWKTVANPFLRYIAERPRIDK